MDDHKALNCKGDIYDKYADVVSRDDGMTMTVLLPSSHDAGLKPPFMVFQNRDKAYLIHSVPDDVPRVCFRSFPEGWMDRTVVIQCKKDSRVITKLKNGRGRMPFIYEHFKVLWSCTE